ncbi:hypothetical protein PUW81_002370 [Microbacterium sp. NM3R9]|uniref:hypothetical protein n=1 Tax=Microbacterium thalli TaxID=3027921 RepID=UPI002366CF1B|nr:hypothetical protein [Microbacterium thalli]MDN8547944.1 hypothetical protein [Microbacterium thalli]
MRRARIGSDDLALVVEADGARIASLTHLPTGRELLASTPWADDPADGFVMADSSAQWHRAYRGGWHLLLPRAGDSPAAVSPPQPFHGEAAWRTWRLASSGDTCRASVALRTLPLAIERRMSVHANTLVIETEVRNHGPVPVEVGWAEHPAFAGDLFREGSIVRSGDRDLGLGAAPAASFCDIAAPAGAVAIAAPHAGIEITVTWDAAMHPRLYVWQEQRGSSGFPWWGAMDAVGLEPASDPYGTPVDALGSLAVGAGESLVSVVSLRVDRRRAVSPEATS